MPRLHCPVGLTPGDTLELPPGAARHVQVLRLQPGDTVTLFNGSGGEFSATVTHMGRSSVSVRVGEHSALEREAPREVHLALAVPANERMDALVEKATELGVASLQALMMARSVVQLGGERAAKRQAHWQAVAAAACEQSGRNRVPVIHPVQALAAWLPRRDMSHQAFVLSPLADHPLTALAAPGRAVLLLSGPEGGLAAEELAAAAAHGFSPAGLGNRVLRADTAPLAALAALTL